MKISFIATILVASANTLAIQRRDCTSPETRKEWRNLSDDEKSTYIDAVKCLKNTASRLSSASTGSLYDDFGYIHRNLDSEIHFVAVFLPWHRWFVYVYEKALQECGYTGSTPYWDWTQDTDDMAASALFDAETGFGGNGDSSTSCVVDGPFTNWTLTTPDDHCLQRNFDTEVFAEYSSSSAVSDTAGLSSYTLFRPALENGPHRGAHAGIAGDMANNYSPNDPIFFLHHGNIDRIWTEWQASNSSRLTEYGGNRYQNNATVEADLTDSVPYSAELFGDDAIVSDLMNTQGGVFCYTYE